MKVPPAPRQAVEQSRTAFTLLELLVAMAMVSIVALTLAGTLKIAFKARDSAEAAVAPTRAADVAADILRVDLESALLPRGLFAGGFTGSADTLQFHAAIPAGDEALAVVAGVPQGDIRRIDLALAPLGNTGQTALVRRVKTNLTASVEEQEVPDEVLCRGVVVLGLRYFDGRDWRDYWDSTQEENRLPQAVEVTLDIQRPDPASPGGYTVARQSRIIRIPCATALPQEEAGAETDPAAAAP